MVRKNKLSREDLKSINKIMETDIVINWEFTGTLIAIQCYNEREAYKQELVDYLFGGYESQNQMIDRLIDEYIKKKPQ